MRRPTARLLTGTALAVVSLGLTVTNATAAFGGDSERGDYGRDDYGRGDRERGSHQRDHDRGGRGRLELSPRNARPGTVVTVSTGACGHDGHGRGEAWSLGVQNFRMDPRHDKERATGEFRVPDDVRPGDHEVRVRCDNGREATGELYVEHRGPSGHVRTGVGGSVGRDTTQIAAGVAVLATAAVGGTRLLRRRASGAQEG
ncbi:hypothetical protein [Streptomyces corynorhini]|uniref:Integral membrane protein n=1 Tax=Streptomyces corynorhini TaxID=2282652 RepID=A0A370B4V2_9ACTN|nr:hypothetical protein [Streptomyces corynorhini]RDG35409.1 hypothetical protein DVH02_25435 [Streptomyces corynorhini]